MRNYALIVQLYGDVVDVGLVRTASVFEQVLFRDIEIAAGHNHQDERGNTTA